MMYEGVCCHDEAANDQLPIAVSFWKHLNSFCIGMFKLNAKFDADLLSYSVILK